jgi:hypothetical protein
VDYAHRRWLLEEGLALVQTCLGGLSRVGAVWRPVAAVRQHRLRLAALLRGLRSELTMPRGSSIIRDESDDDDDASQRQPPCPLCGALESAVMVRARPCGHAYCYACLYAAAAAASSRERRGSFCCRACGRTVRSARPAA